MNSFPGEPDSSGDGPTSNGRLDSWKEIASYLRRSIRSAKRWEKEENLPVHRHHHDKRDTVYAYRTELDEWWSSRGESVTEQNGAEEILAVADEAQADAHSKVTKPAPVQEVSRGPKSHRAAVLLAVGLFVALTIAAAWISKRESRSVSERPPLPFQARDWVLVADFENRSGEKLFDGTLEYALARELSNSRYVNVVPRERIGDALRLMRKPPESPINAEVGREVCLRDGEIRTLLTGRVERLGPRYLFSVEIVEAKQGTTLAGFSEECAGTEGSLAAMRRISDRVRAALGEAPATDTSAKAGLAKVTTSSLRALQLYSRADLLMMKSDWKVNEHNAAAEELLRQAVTEDPNFASAHIHLAYAIHNQGRPKEEALPAAETAYRLSDRTTEGERYFIRGSYYDFVGQKEKAVAAYEALVNIYPDHLWGTNNLAGLYQSEGRFRDAAELLGRRADLRPWDFLANSDAARNLAPLDRARSQPYVRRARALASPEFMQDSDAAWLELLPATENWLDGNLTGALQVADGVAAKIDSLDGNARTGFATYAALFYLTLGRLEAAARCSQEIPDPLLRQEQLARVAFFRNDRRMLKQHLVALEGTTHRSGNTVILLARAGLLPQAARFLNKIEASSSVPGYLQIMRGEVALARGEVDGGIAELEEGTRLVAEERYGPTFLGSESLAGALMEKGDLAHAIQILERASAKRSTAAFESSGAFWLRNQLQLARLYREVGRAEDAQKIEKELLDLLALADSDHPILRELKRRGSI